MPIKIVDFQESTIRNRSQTVNIPDLTSIKNVSVNTGTVTYSVSNKDVTVNVNNGTKVRSDSYTPMESASTNVSGSSSNPNDYAPSIPYSSNGKSGTLMRSGSPFYVGGSASDKRTSTRATTVTWKWVWDGSFWSTDGNTDDAPTTISYTENGYTWTLSKTGHNGSRPSAPSYSGSAIGEVATKTSSATASYEGTLNTLIYFQAYTGFIYGSTIISDYYSYTVTIEYTSVLNIGTHKIQLASSILELPIYDPNIGLEGKNQLRTELDSKIGCFELVPITDPKASPIRIQTPNGVRAIKKE
jgi:hypothetical protein